MAGVDENGFTVKDYPEVVTDITDRANLPENFGASFVSDPDSDFGVHTGVISGSLVDLWNLGQDITSQQNVDTATGIYLDYLGSLVGVIRNQSAGSSGKVLFTGIEDYTVPVGTQVKDNSGRIVSSDEEVTLAKSQAYSIEIEPTAVLPFTNYTVTINGSGIYTYPTGASDTVQDIILGLEAALSGEDSVIAVSINSDEALSITSSAELNNVEYGVTSNLNINTVGQLTQSTAVTTGPLSFPANTLISLATSNPNIISVTNPSAFVVGTDLESDEEYRLRIKTRQQTTGTATKPSIEASLLQVDGVTSAYVVDNPSSALLSGIPAKAYETFVVGGDEDNIANTIWRTKPAGILTHGDISVVILDDNGEEQAVNFSRATELRAWVRVNYTLNPEETFGGTAAMETAIISKGNSMYAGEDLVGSKFYGALYSVPGHFVDSVEVATTQLESQLPSYTLSPISIPVTATLSFSTDRIELI